MTALPASLALNAWTGAEAAFGALDAAAAKWGARTGLPHRQDGLPLDAPLDLTDWKHPHVGYGIILPDNDRSPEEKAAGADAPEPVRDLLAARPGTPVVRWRADLDARFLRRYFPDGTSQDPVIGLTKFGVGKGRLPYYLLIVGGPDTIPWSVQYALNTRHAVGRLPVEGGVLGTYVDALLNGFGTADVSAPVSWTVDHGGGDITSLMRAAIATPLAAKLEDPTLPGFRYVTGPDATVAGLVSTLAANTPALVVTSSHGRTAPLDEPAAMGATLGLPVDVAHATVALDELDAAMPAGSIWYAQACCSAGSDAKSHYEGLLEEGTSAHRAVTAIAGLGATVAPAALRLLGRPAPVRAVLGHVEPTFDWTLSVAETGQLLGGDIVTALSDNLHARQPIGHAFAAYRLGVGVLHTQWANLRGRLDDGDRSVRETLTRLRLTALDRQSLVLLGDPTVTLPPP